MATVDANRRHRSEEGVLREDGIAGAGFGPPLRSGTNIAVRSTCRYLGYAHVYTAIIRCPIMVTKKSISPTNAQYHL